MRKGLGIQLLPQWMDVQWDVLVDSESMMYAEQGQVMTTLSSIASLG